MRDGVIFVTDINPLHAIEVGVTRQDPWADGGEVLYEDERVDLATMIDAYTINGAWLMKREAKLGSIEVGKCADLVVLDRDLFDIPVYEINEAQVTMTLFDGEVVYRRTGEPASAAPSCAIFRMLGLKNQVLTRVRPRSFGI